MKNLWPTKTVWLMLKEVKIRLPNLKVNSLHSLKTSPLEPLKIKQVKISLHLTEAKEAETGLKAMAVEEAKAIVNDLKEARGRMAEAKEKLKVVNVGSAQPPSNLEVNLGGQVHKRLKLFSTTLPFLDPRMTMFLSF